MGREACVDVGGGSEYNSYTCSDAELWLFHEEYVILGMTDETKEYLRTQWRQPKCCSVVADAITTAPTSAFNEEKTNDSFSSSATTFSTTGPLSVLLSFSCSAVAIFVASLF